MQTFYLDTKLKVPSVFSPEQYNDIKKGAAKLLTSINKNLNRRCRLFLKFCSGKPDHLFFVLSVHESTNRYHGIFIAFKSICLFSAALSICPMLSPSYRKDYCSFKRDNKSRKICFYPWPVLENTTGIRVEFQNYRSNKRSIFVFWIGQPV